jgi:AraC family transcriptional regulator
MRPMTAKAYHERILRVLVHIQEHLDEAIELADLARVANFSPYHFHRLFRGMVGESVMEYVRRLRLERAAHRLKFTDRPVTRVALEGGYETHEAFTRAFRARFDEAPSRYRASRRGLPGGGGAEVRVERVSPIRVAFLRHTGPYPAVGATWGRLMAWAGPLGLAGGRALGVVHDDPDVTAPERLRFDACLAVEAGVRAEGEVGLQEVFGGEFAVISHRGSYDLLGDAYARLFGQWLPASGREPRPSPCVEVYLNSPGRAAARDLLTDIYLPLSEE